jgi:hypothetical protein
LRATLPHAVAHVHVELQLQHAVVIQRDAEAQPIRQGSLPASDSTAWRGSTNRQNVPPSSSTA